MRTVIFKEKGLYPRLQTLENQVSYVRKTKDSLLLLALEYLEEVSIIGQAKRERLPIFAYFSGMAFINLDDEALFLALEDRVIEGLIDDTPHLHPFMREARATFRWIPQQ